MIRTSRVVRFEVSGGQWEIPLDLAEIAADNAILDAIACGGQPDGELERLLIDWRRAAHAEPIRELVDADTARAIIVAGRRTPRGARIAWALIWLGTALYVGILLWSLV